eukprot:SAG25_NODE_1736_length_2426_cov_1.626558_2_plen_726_part_01
MAAALQVVLPSAPLFRLGLAAVLVHTLASVHGSSDSAGSVRVATEDSELALELDASTGSITALELGGKSAEPVFPSAAGGFELSEYWGALPCGSAPPAHSANSSVELLENGDFAQRAPDGSAAGWVPSSVPGYAQCTGYRRVTNVTRPGHVASVEASTSKPHELAGASRVISFLPTTAAAFSALVLSGWSKAESDASGTSPVDYSVYADLTYNDGSMGFGEAATFSAGAHDWEFAKHEIRLAKPVVTATVYAMYRNRIGKVWFSDLAVNGVYHRNGSCIPPPSGSAHAAADTPSSRSVAFVASRFTPPSWNSTEAGVTAKFEGMSDHIRITGAVALSRPRPCPYPNPCPPGDAPEDRAVSLQLGFPLAGTGWKLWSDPETFITLPAPPNSSTTMYGGQSEPVAALPYTIDRYPMMVLTAPDDSVGVMLAVPMVPTVQVYRIQYDARRKLLQITFEFGLTSRAQTFPSMATFACLLMPVAEPKWGFRSALDSYYTAFPAVFKENIVRHQGIWGVQLNSIPIPIPDWQDFGILFAEETNEWNATQSKWMNQNGILIFPYVEPSNIHYCLPGVQHATWETVHGVIGNCSMDDTCQNQCFAKSIVNNAVVGANGDWVWAQCCADCGANAAIFMFAGLNPVTLSDPCSWTSYMLARLNAAYDKSVVGGYDIAGLYVDGMVAFHSMFTHINYRDTALHSATHPPVFDASGRIAVLSAQDLLAFMDVLAKKLH